MRLDDLAEEDLSRLLKRYCANALPGARRPLLFLKRRFGWRAEKRPDGTAKQVGDWHVQRHLAGHLIAGANWGLDDAFYVRHAVIDLDADNLMHRKRRRFQDRLKAVLAALGKLPYVMLRSSASKGLHIYIFLDKWYRAPDVRSAILDRLHAADVRVASGEVEVWPARTALRLPLGQGSCIVDKACQPLHASVDSLGRLRRDVVASINAFCEFAERNRISLTTIIPARQRARGVTHKRSRSSSPHALPVHSYASISSTYQSRIDEIKTGIPAYGMRHEAANLFLWNVFVRRGSSKKKSLKKFRRWLEGEDHNSKDLDADPVGTRNRMMRDAARYLDHLHVPRHEI